MSAIDVRNVSVSYGQVQALHSVNLEVHAREFLTVLGPSGSGKSTLLGVVSGLMEPSSGRIEVGGRDITALPTHQRKMGLVFQNYALFPTMSVAHNVAFGLKVRGEKREVIDAEVERALAMVRLEGYGGRRVQALSGGQQQRVALARAIVINPTVLLLDEPLGALDRKLRQEVQVELRELQRSLGITTVMVTHDQEEALTLSDRIAIVNNGRIEQIGTPDELYARPVSSFVANFLGTSNEVRGTIDRTGGSARFTDGALSFECGEPAFAGSEAIATIRPEAIRVDPAAGAFAAAGDGIAASIRDAIYLGGVTRYHLALESGHEWVALSRPDHPPIGRGEHVVLTWPPEAVWLLDPTPAGGNQ
ncbi:putative spermidine/putrescine transport system ATP-binding protein [Leucobacter komagatae]|uniref:ABC-type quaternary amine transporter n=1 Tax=Leucobacter komagatae TaxID=55969 RepID=A0A542Y291_9MICO|nr:ABC transporter ATP-binding protein [Leucobacter komagatae]TQL42201.1 putative spermidine/putrescine transport system ATP-binding protein [Leucobacter komagatae]